MNIEERQQAVQAPQGTYASPVPDRSEASAPRSHSEKLPAGRSAGPPEAPFLALFLLLIPQNPDVIAAR